jgi:hypothetical protein
MAVISYQDALRRRDELRKQLADIEEFIRLWNELFGTEGEQNRLIATLPPHPMPAANGQRAPRSPTRERAAGIARRVILAKGKPMTRGELVAAFRAEGEPVAGEDPSKNMGTIMWRLRDRFVNIEGQGYWPSDTPLPEVGYQPPTH